MHSNRSKRLHYLDALRGLAALGVVVAHYAYNLRGARQLTAWEDWVVRLLDDPVDTGKLGVALFFLISGYIVPNSLGPSNDRIGRFVVTRFFRLYPLYWAAIALSLLFPWSEVQPLASWNVICANLTMVQGFLRRPDIVQAAWTLEIELTFYGACVLLASRRLLASSRACTLVGLSLLAFAVVLAAVRYGSGLKLPVALPLALCLMFLGTVWRQATLDRQTGAAPRARQLLWAVALAILPISLLAYNKDYGQGEHWTRYAFSYAAGLALFIAGTTRLRITWAPLVRIGEISYSLYLLHALAPIAARRADLGFERLGLDPFVHAVLLVAASVACSELTYRFIEQPCQRLGRRLTRPGSAIRPNAPNETLTQASTER